MADTAQTEPLDVVQAMTVLLGCQLAGEAAVAGMRQIFPYLSFPGPVVGMAILFLILVWRNGPERNLGETGDGILRNLSLLFVPAAVGIVQQGPLLAEYGVLLLITLVVSAVLTLIVTAAVFQFVADRLGVGDENEHSIG